MDIAISFPSQGHIRLESRDLFAEPGNETLPAVSRAGLPGSGDHRRHDQFASEDRRTAACRPAILPFVVHASRRRRENLHLPGPESEKAKDGPQVDAQATREDDGSDGHAAVEPDGQASASELSPSGPHGVTITRVTPIRNEKGQIRFFRYGSAVTNWEVKHEIPGRLRIKNSVIHRKADLCQAIERELMSVLGVDSYKTNPLTSTVLVQYDPKELTRDQIIEIIDGALATAEHPPHKDRPDLHLPLCTVSMPLAAAAQFAAPGLLPVAAGLFAYTSIPTFKNARAVLVEEKRLGVDVLDAIVVLGCLGTMSIFPGAVLCWCLGFGRVLVKKTQDNSKKLLLNAFGKQPRFVWLYRDGVEVQVALDRLQAGDIIVVNTGEVVAGGRDHRRRSGHDRPARPDRRVDSGRERRG